MGCGLGLPSENPIGVGAERLHRGASAPEAGHEGKKSMREASVGQSLKLPFHRADQRVLMKSPSHSNNSIIAQPRAPNQTVMTGIIKVARRAIASFRLGSPSEKCALIGSVRSFIASRVLTGAQLLNAPRR